MLLSMVFPMELVGTLAELRSQSQWEEFPCRLVFTSALVPLTSLKLSLDWVQKRQAGKPESRSRQACTPLALLRQLRRRRRPEPRAQIGHNLVKKYFFASG